MLNMAHFGDKLRALIAQRNIGVTEFYVRAGISWETLRRALKSETNEGMHSSTYRAIANTLGMTPEELDEEWKRPDIVPQQQGPGIPIINKAPAGVGEYTDLGFDNGVGAYDDAYLPRSLCPGDDLAFAVWVVGDSMIPEFRAGDLLVCSPRAAMEGRIQDGDVVCVRFTSEKDDENCVKRVYDRGAEVELVSDNRQYRPMIVPKEHIARMAKVVKRITSYV